MNKPLLTLTLTLAAVGRAAADPAPMPSPTPAPQGVGSVWGHPSNQANPNQAGAASLYADQLAHGVGDLITIVVDLSNSVNKAQNTSTSKATSVAATLGSLVYPPNGSNNGWNFYTYHGAVPTSSWTSAQSFNGGGTVANSESQSTTIQARVIEVMSNGVLRVEAVRLSKAGDEDTRMILTGLVRPEDLATDNSISSSRVADLQIVQKGKGTLTEDQRKGWLTKFYEFINPF
jgi:flagellar L-ring protein precursor FlgH